MNWESPASTRLKNPIFKSLWELGKSWKYNIRPTFKSPNFKSMGNLQKACHIPFPVFLRICQLIGKTFFTGKNEILNPLGFLGMPQNFKIMPFSPNVKNVNVNSNR